MGTVTVAVMNFWRVYLAVKWIGKRFIEWDEYFALRIPPVRNRIPPVHGNDTTS